MHGQRWGTGKLILPEFHIMSLVSREETIVEQKAPKQGAAQDHLFLQLSPY